MGTVQADAANNPPSGHIRLSAVDHLRGLVMVIMVLDHAREFFMNYGIDPTDLARTNGPLFFTRWITHFCAPVFVFLAGTGAYLSHARGKSLRELSLFLATRGLWLMVLEVTLVKLGWFFHLDYSTVLLQVIWTIGAAMICLSALIFLPVPVIAAIGLAIVLGHNLFDGALKGSLGSLGSWSILLRPGAASPRAGTTVIFAYSLIPWLGVMALGYAFGPVLTMPHHRRRRLIFGLGAALTVAFLALRWLNVYGDPAPWKPQATWSLTIISFLNCQKYPPSLLYLLMTLGPALMLLAWFDAGPGAIGRRLVEFGRVPLFFYLLQWPTVHGLAILVALSRGESIGWFFKDAPFSPPPGYGYGLGMVYLMWIVAVLLLYFPCRWFGEVKRRNRAAWLSYF
ncbi:MAG: hypothetical protein ABS79_05625 [Planctomycetes bacterium SCN 63-9]|nr:MAG: hypothetical protein ABS79_05625 [Planctomycetes bacterium SCN 63-9]